MPVSCGPFTVDEAGRSVFLAGREIAMQPLVLDLFLYLLRHSDRVVPKDELLDALWPGVLVTDNSVQRAVSLLRAHLREGGLADALRNIPRAGYRLRVDAAALAAAQPGPVSTSAGSPHEGPLALARSATVRQCWSEAVNAWKDADAAGPLTGSDLDAWALACQCLGRPAEAVPLAARAVSAHLEAGDPAAAAASAITLSAIHLERGEVSLARGWLARSLDLVEDRPDAPAVGLSLWMKSRLAAFAGEPEQALALAEESYSFGRRRGILTVEALGLMYRGFFRLSLGLTAQGLADQDHAATLALSGRIDPVVGGTLYCNILWACRTFGDWARADQWTLGYQDFCSSSGMQFSGSCQLHRAEVLGVRGSLTEALARIEDAVERLSGETPWALGDAYRVLGDTRAALGDTGGALAAYERCDALGWDPEPGRARLLLEAGDANAACAGLERSLVGNSWWTLQRQGLLRAHLAVALVDAGRHGEVARLIDDFETRRDRWPMPSIRALYEEARAALSLADDRTGPALSSLQLARELWTSIGCRLNAARLRLAIAGLLLRRGDRTGAGAEARAAQSCAMDLGARLLDDRCRELLSRL